MGIEFTIQTKSNDEKNSLWVERLGQDVYCKFAWRNITFWKLIFSKISFNISLLYDSFPNYWSTCQLKDILDKMKLISSDLRKVSIIFNYEHYDMRFDKDEYETWCRLKPDLDKLIDIFQDYVDHEAIIIVN